MLLGSALEEQREREAALRAVGDPRDLHRYRITLRRTRALLAAGRPVLPSEELVLLEALVASHAGTTALARDLDVLLDAYDGLVAPLPTSVRSGAPDLRAALVRMKEHEYRSMLASLDGAAHASMLRRWSRLAAVYRVGGSDPGPDAARPTGDVIDDQLWKAFRRVRRQGKVALRSDDVEEWHALRKRAKRLRYLLEWFGPLYDRGTIKPLRRHLRSLQESFGTLQDEVVRVDLLTAAATDLSGAGAMTAGALVARESYGLPTAVQRCAEEWLEFDVPAVRSAVRAATSR